MREQWHINELSDPARETDDCNHGARAGLDAMLVSRLGSFGTYGWDVS